MKRRTADMVKVKHPRYSWVVKWFEGGKVRKAYYRSRDEALEERSKKEKELERLAPEEEGVTAAEWHAVREARLAGVDLLQAVREFAGVVEREREAREREMGMTVWAFMLRRLGPGSAPGVSGRKRLDPVAGTGPAGGTMRGVSDKHRKDAARVGWRFAALFRDLPLTAVKPGMISEFLYSRPGSAASVKAWRVLLHGHFAWAVEQGFLEVNPVKKVKPPRESREEIAARETVRVFSPREAEEFLRAAAEPELCAVLPMVAIALFTGLRVAELLRLKWMDVQPERGFVEVRKSTAKTRGRRLVLMEEALKCILLGEPCRTIRASSEPLARVWPVNGARLLDRVKKRCGWRGSKAWAPPSHPHARTWPKNALRDSFASYHLAHFGSAARTAEQCGHSEGVLFRHYREVVTPAAAAAFWAIRL